MEETRLEELGKVAQTIFESGLLQDHPAHHRPRIMQELSRTALGLSPDIDISALQASDREALLHIMCGVRDLLISTNGE